MSLITERLLKQTELDYDEGDGNTKLEITAISINHSAVAADNRKVLECTGDIEITLPAASTIIAPSIAQPWSDYMVAIKNVGTGVITVTPSGVEEIDGVAGSVTVAANKYAEFKVNAAADGYVTLSPQRFRGCVAFTTQSGVFGDGAFTASEWTDNEYDTDNIHDLGGDLSLFTVPANVTRVKLSGCILASNINETVNLRSVVQKNGGGGGVGNAANQTPAINGNVVQYQWATPVLNVVPGDTFNVGLRADVTGGPVVSGSNSTWMAMEIIE